MFRKLFFFLLIWLCSGALRAQSTTNWQLIFEDEFEGTGFNTQTWSYCKRGTPDWNKYLISSSQTVAVENGVLKVRAIKNTNLAADPVPYHTGGIESRGKFNFRYGKAEIKAKFNNGQGSWPAIWMMPTKGEYGGWPGSGEIDIMENVGYDPDTIVGTVHTQAYNHSIGTQKGKRISIPDCHETFHLYALEWEPEELRIYVDSTLYFTYKNEGTGSEAWPFDKPFYLLLNVAVGGNWGGSRGVDDTIFPQQMVVDYVRVYQKPEAIKQ